VRPKRGNASGRGEQKRSVPAPAGTLAVTR
jgi:hypothetical protein